VPGFFGPTPPPPHEVASFLMQSAMLGGRDLKGRALDQPAHVLAGEPTDFDAKALGLGVEHRPVDEDSGRRVEEPQQAAWCAVVDVVPSLGGHHAALDSTVQLTPITG
jgi:hypothetical protein